MSKHCLPQAPKQAAVIKNHAISVVPPGTERSAVNDLIEAKKKVTKSFFR